MEIKSISRLKFRHHDEVFTGATLEDARALAVNYVTTEMWYNNPDEECNGSDPIGHSLYGEPTVVKYSLEGDENNAHLILAVGVETNDTTRPDNNKFCFIDIDKTEGEIEELWEEIEKIIKSLTLSVIDTDSLNLEVEKTDEGTILSGNVKTPIFHVFDNQTKYSNLMVAENNAATGTEGLFIYVDLTYDEASETFAFVASQYDGTLKKQEVKLPNNYLVSGEYDVKDESIHLKMKNGDEIVINCENLIAEWMVEGDASKTPIVLTREEVEYDGTDEHHHVEPWQDVLRADVRIASGRTNNILRKTIDGRYLYVDGEAKNIVYYWNGESTTVEQQLNKLNQIKISPDRDNIIWDSPAGYFATVDLEYISAQNKLRFTKTNVSGEIQTTELPLNTVTIIESITYDPVREVLVIKYRNDKGEIEYVEVPISGMIDEWEVYNAGHNVKLKKTRHISGKDILTADVNISNTEENNILEEKGEGDLHALYVKGTADNIKENTDGNVQTAIDNLRVKDSELNDKIDQEIADRTADVDAEEARAISVETALNTKIESEIADRTADVDAEEARAISVETALDTKIDAVSADSANSLKDIINNDKSINVDKTDAVRPTIKVNLSNKSGNTINLVTQDGYYGLYSTVDISYDSAANELTLTKSTSAEGETTGTTVKLNNGISVIERIEYDAATEEIVIYYKTTSGEEESIRIPVSHIINEWTTGETNTVLLNKERVISGGPDVLTANVKVCHDEHHQDNAIEVHQNGLYVHSYSGEVADLNSKINTVSGDVITEKNRADAAEQALDIKISQEIVDRTDGDRTLEDEIQSETTRAQLAENTLSSFTITAINEEKTRAMTAEGALDTAITDERRRAEQADALLQDAINDEAARSEAKDAEHDSKIAALEVSANTLDRAIEAENRRAMSAETALDTKIDDEATRAINAENELDTNLTSKIDTTAAAISGYVVTQIEGEKSRAIIAEQTIDGKITQEVNDRTNSETIIRRDITDEVARAERTEEELRNAISAQTLNFKDTTSIDFERVGTDVTAIVKVATDSANTITNNLTGLYSTVDFEYNGVTNKLTLKRNNLPDKEIQLNAGSIVDRIEYDSVHKNIIIIYKTAAGETRTVTIPAEELVNEWTVDNDGTPIKLTKTLDPSGVTDVLRADVKIASAHTDNLLMVDGDALYVPGDIVASAATIAECVSGRTDAIYKTLFGDVAPGGCGEGIEYKPDVHNCIISAATSFQDADQLMAYQLCEILEMWVSAMTCTSISNWIDDGANKKLEVDVRGSYGQMAGMTEDDLYITDLTGKTIEPGVTEFTDTNALRIVCLEDGGSVIPDVKARQNGLFLSNVWNCGKYYDSTNATDMAGHDAVQADGYNADYWTDNNSSASGYNYNNYNRQ